MLGERLYPLVTRYCFGEDPGKITGLFNCKLNENILKISFKGMLLEMDNAEILVRNISTKFLTIFN